MFEYTDNPATWKFQKLPDVEIKYERELRDIGGLTPSGAPRLRVVKGNEALSDRSEEVRLKYHCGYSPAIIVGYEYRDTEGEKQTALTLEDVPADAFITDTLYRREPLGHLRYIIEKWTSPAELEEMGRFTHRTEAGDIAPTLREFPRDGIYEHYFTVETPDNKFRIVDNLVMEFIRFKWQFEAAKTDEEREKIYYEQAERAERRERAVHEERMDAILAGDLRLPEEERERRREYWDTYDYTEDRARGY